MSEIGSIGEFNLTDRDLSTYLNTFGLGQKDINRFPRNGKVLNVGSGFYRTFEKQLAEARNDLTIVSIDPSLGIFTINEQGKFDTQGFKVTHLASGSAIYDLNNNKPYMADKWVYRGLDAIEYDRQRKLVATEVPGATAALVSALPFPDNCFDVVFDVCGPIQYLRDLRGKRQYLTELKRVMSDQCTAFVSSLDSDEMSILRSLKVNFARTKAWQDESFCLTKG